MSHLTEDQVSDLRATLEAERDSLDEELAGHGRKVGGDWEGSSKSKGEESDPNDSADNIEALAANVPLVEELEGRRREVGKALESMDQGTYGTCTVCKKDIPFDRLEANPAGATCLAHTP